MAGRVPLIAVAAFAVGIGVASLVPGASSSLRKLIGFQTVGGPSPANERRESDKEAGKEDKPILVKLTDDASVAFAVKL
jgi:hypothetical protein